ncbi:hypothetical protein BD324DRAFT_617281 [Kockovaella imperatae]|uniref:ATP-grasp domain-containing protein n=1 Tax=Kockovaella imperatae TaxID=4999 RepID=A0A1Y1USY2_9TREE|nr:hypothetical protein BD324DRAFT_617281 [Kockovaella imperatae]ORX40315.1 hypothetical protein BD324DRAFT_617281 [Kockovaella imperatae]
MSHCVTAAMSTQPRQIGSKAESKRDLEIRQIRLSRQSLPQHISRTTMPRQAPTRAQSFVTGVVVPLLSLCLLPVSILAVAVCLLRDRLTPRLKQTPKTQRCVIISGGRMSKGLHLARAFKRAGWKVIGVEETGWGELCPMRFSKAVDSFHLVRSPTTSFEQHKAAICAIASSHRASLFIPVSGVASSVQDAMLAEALKEHTKGVCETFIQDQETMEDLHDKDRFISLLVRLGIPTPAGTKVTDVDQAIAFFRGQTDQEPRFIIKCLGLDENRGDMTLYPLARDDEKLTRTRLALESLTTRITKRDPYVLQEFITGQEWCTHASVIDGQITSFVTCPSNDMLMTYEDATTEVIGQRAELWTRALLAKLKDGLTASGKKRRLTGHFSFDFIHSTKDDEMYPLECNARVHTAIILLPLDDIAGRYDHAAVGTLRPRPRSLPRSWIYNDLIMRYLPRIIPDSSVLSLIHPSLPACLPRDNGPRPFENPLRLRVDPSLVADDPIPFLVLWHLWWPSILLKWWWQGRRWTRLNVSTGRIFEA